MKRFEKQKAYLVCMVIMSVFISILAGCGGGGGGSWTEPAAPGTPGTPGTPIVSIVSLNVTPALASIPVTGTQQYTATAVYSDGTTQNVTATSTWTAANLLPLGGPAIATVSSTVPTKGQATGNVIGQSTITATFGSLSQSVTLTVNAATSTSFEVIPAAASITITGGSQQFVAIETFSNGTTQDRTAASTWTATNRPLGGPAVANVSSTAPTKGLATGNVVGQADITATYVLGSVTQTDSAILTVIAPNPGAAGAAVNLRTASTYGIIATNAITSSSVTSHIYGDVALTAGVASSVTGPNLMDAGAAPNLTSSGVTTANGNTPGIVNTSDNGNLTIAQMAQLQSDLNAAYADLQGRPAPATPLTTPASAAAANGGTFAAGATDLSGFVLRPGIYRFGTSSASVPADTIALSSDNGPLVLDAQGNPDAVFIFQAGAMTTTNGSVVLQGGAQAKNVFWVVTSDATIGTTGPTFFQGTLVAGNTITVLLGNNVQGRMLAGALGAGAITNSGVITVPK